MGFWGRGHDHIGNFNFRIEIEGLASARFKQLDGIVSETEVITYGGTVDQLQRKRPGRSKWQDVTLKRGFTNDPNRVAKVGGQRTRREAKRVHHHLR